MEKKEFISENLTREQWLEERKKGIEEILRYRKEQQTKQQEEKEAQEEISH